MGEENGDEVEEKPFTHTLGLSGPDGEIVQVDALFDGGAMVGAMCLELFRQVQHLIGGGQPSRKRLRMADGTIVPSQAVWRGQMMLGGVCVEGQFEVFDSHGGWSFLFGKPLLRAFKALHDHGLDTVSIRAPSGGNAIVLHNQTGQVNTKPAEDGQKEIVRVEKPDTRQVPQSVAISHVRANNDTEEPITQNVESGVPAKGPTDILDAVEEHSEREYIIDIEADRLRTDLDLCFRTYEARVLNIANAPQTAGTIFTRHSEPFKPERIEKILEEVCVGDDITQAQRQKVRDTLAEFADCFALAISEVNPVPGAVHKLNVPEGAKFRTKIGQRSLNPAQRKFLDSKVDEMLNAGIIAPIHPRDVKCVASTVLAQKAHEGQGLTLDELKHKVNDQCVAHGLPSAFDLPPRPEKPDVEDNEATAQKWRICQDFNELNKVTQVAPVPHHP